MKDYDQKYIEYLVHVFEKNHPIKQFALNKFKYISCIGLLLPLLISGLFVFNKILKNFDSFEDLILNELFMYGILFSLIICLPLFIILCYIITYNMNDDESIRDKRLITELYKKLPRENLQ